MKIPEHWIYRTFQTPEWLQFPLTTIDGQPFFILHPGERNWDNGPDFRNVLVEVAGVRYRGDVECHIHWRDWFAHGHHQDLRYQNVIAHMVWEAADDIPEELRQRFFHVVLSRQLRIPFQEWYARMQQLDAENASPLFSVSARCTKAYVQELAWQRWNNRMERYRVWVRKKGFAHTFLISIAEVLGYSKNKFPMRQLMWEITPGQWQQHIPRLHWSPLVLWGYLVYRAGLLPSLQHLPPRVKHRLEALFIAFSQRGIVPILQVTDWNFSRLRPVNHPFLRLAILANWLYQYSPSQLFQSVLAMAMERLPMHQWIGHMRQFFCQPLPAYFIPVLQGVVRFQRLKEVKLGEVRFRQLMVNSILPILMLWAKERHEFGFQQYLESCYEQFPSCEDGEWVKKFQNLVSDIRLKKALKNSALLQQGMFEWLARQEGSYHLRLI